MINIPSSFFTTSKHPFKILLISGGHGSSDFIKKIWEKEVYKKNIQIRVLFNPFDDGASYGIVRDILGVSCLGDGRKNQYNMFLQLYGDYLPDYVKLIYKILFEDRHKFDNSTQYIESLITHIWTLLEAQKHHLNEPFHFTDDGYKVLDMLLSATKQFVNTFYVNKSHDSFNISNMFYGILEYYSTSSIQDLLNSISSSVFCLGNNGVMTSLNDSARLISYTEKGMTLSKETPDVINFKEYYSLLGYDNIVNQSIKPYRYSLKEPNFYIDRNVEDYILRCDLMLVCPGTLYSSLNPTFLNKNIWNLVIKSTSKKYMYINDEPDSDFMTSKSGNYKHQYYYNSYFSHRHKLISEFTLLYKTPMEDISNKVVNVVDYDNFLYSLMSYYFNDKLIDIKEFKDSILIFDYDGTLYSASDGETSDSLINNMNELLIKDKAYISTGNYTIRTNTTKLIPKNIFLSNVYNKDFNNIDYKIGLQLNNILLQSFDDLKEIYPIYDLLKNERVDDIITTIKHIGTDVRHLVSSDLNRKIENVELKHPQRHDLKLRTYCLGKTSIDFIYDSYLKKNLDQHLNLSKCIYIGDGVNNPYSNDSEIAKKCKLGINVRSIVETLLLLECIK